MARVAITEDNLSEGSVDLFDRLKLETNEFARLMLPTGEAECQWVHTMRAPVIEHGVPVKEQKKRRNGSFYDDYSTEFVGQRVCVGDASEGGPLDTKGLDPEGCPACLSAKNGVKDMAPERRYAVPVIRYDTRSKGSADVRTPPGAKILVWALTWRMWDQLVRTRAQIRELYGWAADHPVSMNQADIVLFCEDGGWQRVRFEAPRRPAWAAKTPDGEALKNLVHALWKEVANRPTEAQLIAACGRTGGRDWMVQDVEDVETAWRAVRAHENGTTATQTQPDRGGAADLGAGLDELDTDALLGAGPEAGPGTPPDEPDLGAMSEFMDDEQKAAAAAAPAANGNGKPAAAKAAPKAAAAEAAAPAEDSMFEVPEGATTGPEGDGELFGVDGEATVPETTDEPGSFDDLMEDLDVK